MISGVTDRMGAIVARFDAGAAPGFSAHLAAVLPPPDGADTAVASGLIALGAPALPAGTGLAAMIRAASAQAPTSLLGPQLPAAPDAGGGRALPAAAHTYRDQFAAAGARHGVAPELLAAVAWTESGFRADAVSPAGAIGLMQIMPATAAALGVDPRDPAQAIDGAARYLRQALDQFGDIRLALAAYNAGPGAVERFGGIPPYPETQTYVQKVMARLPGAST
jgi:soluble lytic murein transglycosylase-like protein